eukprot:Plantae.Rhodophyta-Rhodochaete_pulchella.ctg9844.p1 GENE.Plantae.Rhodophyta-Rhodochaete_pulchella.ctg9844~~Plantae.Rhodophyta-Rhodochaete_pulchella.ctg9844.p1  ORF type:complete len:152 (-),score=16.21 Plantae.Rhodophyta-Rhodochaete_pulchella.ctg9844:2053-2508(-)
MTTALKSTVEKRLLIDISILRQAYYRNEIDRVARVKSADNPADCQLSMNSVMNKALDETILENQIVQWIVHREQDTGSAVNDRFQLAQGQSVPRADRRPRLIRGLSQLAELLVPPIVAKNQVLMFCQSLFKRLEGKVSPFPRLITRQVLPS